MFPRPLFKNHLLPATPPLRFPQKLWKIANECQTGAVCWSPDGKSILLRYSLFREEFMSTKTDFFKTDNISSFVRQLNLYGFRKVYDHAHKQAYKANPDFHEFSHSCFQRERPDLLDKVTRKACVLKEKNEFWPEGNKSMEFLDENSSERWDICDTAIKTGNPALFSPNNETNDSLNKPEEQVAENIFEDTVDENKPVQDITANEDDKPVQELAPCKEKVLIQILVPDKTGQSNAELVPPKKKRGRKPGSKSKKTLKSNICPKINDCPSLKHPEKYPELLYFNDDDDDSVFLRNTSKDVMLSSTLPFQETPEFRVLKEEYIRQNEMKLKALRYYEKALKNYL